MVAGFAPLVLSYEKVPIDGIPVSSIIREYREAWIAQVILKKSNKAVVGLSVRQLGRMKLTQFGRPVFDRGRAAGQERNRDRRRGLLKSAKVQPRSQHLLD